MSEKSLEQKDLKTQQCVSSLAISIPFWFHDKSGSGAVTYKTAEVVFCGVPFLSIFLWILQPKNKKK